LHPSALKAVEFDRIVGAVTRIAQTPPGRERLSRLNPAVDAEEVQSGRASTAEAVRFLSGAGEIALRAPAELDAILTGLAVEGRILEPQYLLGFATFLASVDAPVAGVRRNRGLFPLLAGIVDAAVSCERESADGRGKIDASRE